MVANNKKIKDRFIKDYKLPISIFDDEMFSYYMALYDFAPNDVWESLLKTVEKKYDGNAELWLNYCASVRDNAIMAVTDSEVYKEFLAMDMSKYAVTLNCGERSCYNGETDGKEFLSVDLKKANFQVMKYLGVIDFDTYEDFIGYHGADDYIKGSKYLRQVIFGKMNPGRQIKVSKYIMNLIYDLIKPITDKCGLEIFSLNSDELIYAKTDKGVGIDKNVVDAIENIIEKELDVKARVEYIKVKQLPIVNCNGSIVEAFVRTNILTGSEVLKKASATFFPQIYKLWKGLPLFEMDKRFFFEGQTATFDNYLSFKENEDISKQ